MFFNWITLLAYWNGLFRGSDSKAISAHFSATDER